MGKAGIGWVMRVWLVLALTLVPFPARADRPADRQQGSGDRGTDMVLDLLLLRPLGLLVTGVGSVAFVVSLPFTLPSGSAGAAACELVREPLAYTFSRPLGDLEAGGRHCPDGDNR